MVSSTSTKVSLFPKEQVDLPQRSETKISGPTSVRWITTSNTRRLWQHTEAVYGIGQALRREARRMGFESRELFTSAVSRRRLISKEFTRFETHPSGFTPQGLPDSVD